ncbi:MAG: hypothetical protein IKO55_17590 [Kiritimatiellae bacterium]|nr:hypothetical protein [Kiritimatiellia bacterium]
MKYTYAYKTSDGKRHEAAMDAESREAVFEALRTKGIKAIKVVASDGSKANGEDSHKKGASRKGETRRVALRRAIFAALLLLPILLLIPKNRSDLFFGIFGKARPAQNPAAFVDSQTRRQVIGDVAVVEKGVLTGWSEVFPEEGERFFASFAVPGVRAGQRNTTVEEIEASLRRKVSASPDDSLEARQIKAMVEGMKSEARAYIAAGGSIVEYGKRLVERQEAEIAIYERAKSDFEAARKAKSEDELVAYWETLNDRLRNLGIKLLPLE